MLRRPEAVAWRDELDRNEAYTAAQQRTGQCTAAGTDLDDELAGSEVRLCDETLGELETEEVLAELPTPCVARRPPSGGGH